MADTIAALGAPVARARKTISTEGLAAWLLVMPSTLAFVAMLLLPTLATAVLAFTDYQLGETTLRFVGMTNFAEMFADRGFNAAVRNTAIYVLFVTPLSIFGALGVALLIEGGTRGRVLFRTIFFLPVVSLLVAMSTAWQYLLHPTIGPVNTLLRVIGLGQPNWFGASDTVLISLGFIGVWQNVGFNMVLFLAGLTAIPRELYAAAEIDGAKGAVSRFRLVTWPLLGPTTLFVVTITTISAIRVFDTVRALTQGGPNRASEVMLHLIYMEGFSFFRMGYAAAITLVFLAVVLVLMLIQTRVLDRRVHYG
jgi:multiple sugar transport system permease protein